LRETTYPLSKKIAEKCAPNGSHVVFGDGLTVERMRESRRLTCTSQDVGERIHERMTEGIQEFHKEIALSEVNPLTTPYVLSNNMGCVYHLKK
jgi:hypothetical protein